MRRTLYVAVVVCFVAVIFIWRMLERESINAPPLAPPTSPATDSNSAHRVPSPNDGARADRPAPPATTAATSEAETDDSSVPEEPPSRPAELRWDGPGIVKAGSPFTVTLRLTSEARVRVVPMQLRFDPQLLELVSVRAGDFFGDIDGGSFGYTVNRPGSVRIGVSGRAPAAAADSALIVVTFKTPKPGTLAQVSIAAMHLERPGSSVPYDTVMPFIATVTP